MPHHTNPTVNMMKIKMSELTNLLLNLKRLEGCNSVRVGKDLASETESSCWLAVFLERLGARCGKTGLSSADA
ncbi:hypothetical protein D3C74_486320 [compost metagenome]